MIHAVDEHDSPLYIDQEGTVWIYDETRGFWWYATFEYAGQNEAPEGARPLMLEDQT